MNHHSANTPISSRLYQLVWACPASSCSAEKAASHAMLRRFGRETTPRTAHNSQGSQAAALIIG
ncbi:MAG: hAT transposon family protein [Anaerolineaceae bacterium]|nr:hAT transposon family protein [Anaerolineaceae bacterium]